MVEIRVCGHEGCGLLHHVGGVTLVSFSSSQEAAVVKHILTGGVQGPVVALSRVTGFTRDFHETVIERQVVANAVLPGWELLPVVWKPVHDKITDS